jgi:CheY-like chemotaxis protein
MVTVSVSPAVVSELEARKKGLTAGPHARLRIVDTGVGMTPEVLQRAFEPFFTTKPVGNGTGLGLSVIRSILDRMEGAIDLTSTPGQGTTATVLLPTVRSLEPTGGRPAAGQSVPSRKHILYVEDEHALADLARRQLQALGYRVTVFTSSTEALEEFRTDPAIFDAMVTDSNMPRLSGTSLTQIVKSIRPSLPIVMISGMGNSPERTPIPTVDRLIPKPFRLAALDQALKELL